MAKKNLPYPAEKIGELLIEVDNEVAKKSDLNDFVKKESGRGLSTNDYTTAEKAKLAGIQEGAQKNTVTSVRGALQLLPQVGNVVISAADIGLGNANTRLTALEENKLDKSEKGANNGIASLDENGRVPSSQLPSYVDDVIEVVTFAALPFQGESGKIYITRNDNKTYRWSGDGYAEISASLALGETEQTAYSGAKGKKNAEDIAKLAVDLNVTHQLASNAESAISEVVELVIPEIENDLAGKASKEEAQGYAATAKSEAIAAAATDAQTKANTAESNANDYTDGAVDDLAKEVATNKTNIATHTQQIANLDSNKLGKTEKAADSAKADRANDSALLGGKYGYQYGQNILNETVDIDAMPNGTWGGKLFNATASAVGFPTNADGYGAFLSAAYGKYGIQFIGRHDGYLFARVNDNVVRQWRQIAFTDSTVAKADSATKLTTPRSLWGQSFDGTGDVDGQPTINASILLRATVADAWRAIRFMQTAGNTNAGEILFQAGVDKNGVKIVSEYGDWAHRQNLVIYTSNNTVSPYAPVWVAALMVKHNGNVGIGTTAPTEKLEVSGNAKISGQLSTDSYIVSTGALIGGGDNVCQITNNAATVEMRVTAAGSARLMRWKDGAGKVIIESDGINTTLRTGNVAIGGTSASEKLDVAGNIKASGSLIGNLKGTIERVSSAGKMVLLGFAGDGSTPVYATNVSLQDGVLTIKGLRVEGDVEITGNTVITGSLTSGASYQATPVATVSEGDVPSVEQQLRSQISSLEERIAALEQLIAQNNG